MSTPETVVSDAISPPVGAPPQPEAEAPAASPPAAKDPSETEAKEKSGVSKRIDELTRLRRDAERERDRWYETAMELQKRGQAPAPPQPKPSEPESEIPTLEQFNWDVKAHAKAVAEKFAPKPEMYRQALTEAQQQQAAALRAETFRERESTFAAEHEDYDEVAHEKSLPISKAVGEALMDAEEGPELLYHLGKNPAIAKALSKLSPGAAGIELGKLAAKLAVEKAKASEPKVSKAPPPTPKVEGADAGISVKSASDPESDKLSADEWRKLREKEVRRRK